LFSVETRTVDGQVTAVGSAGPFRLVVDRPVEASGGGKGFNGAQLLYLAIAVRSNDLFREAPRFGVGPIRPASPSTAARPANRRSPCP
jgi:hypothetical protein